VLSRNGTGVDVTLIGRGPHLAAVQEQGLTITSSGETFTVKPRAVEKDSRHFNMLEHVFFGKVMQLGRNLL
jgi:ketopantoate reductase